MADRCVVELNEDVLIEMAEAAKQDAIKKYGKSSPCGSEIEAQLLPMLREAVRQRCGHDRITEVTLQSDVPFLADLVNNDPLGELLHDEEIRYSFLAGQAVILLGKSEASGFGTIEISRV